jgi:hypothetical protein
MPLPLYEEWCLLKSLMQSLEQRIRDAVYEASCGSATVVAISEGANGLGEIVVSVELLSSTPSRGKMIEYIQNYTGYRHVTIIVD